MRDDKRSKGRAGGRLAYLIRQKVDFGLILFTAARAHLDDA